MRNVITRKSTLQLSVGSTKVTFYQSLETTEDYWVEFSVDKLSALTREDQAKITAFGKRTVKKVRNAWA